jgi:sugar phosphate isomerase/epimerase
MLQGLAVQLYTLRARLDADLDTTLSALAGAGARHVELAGLYGRDGAQMRAALDSAGLTAVAAHVGIDRFEAEPDVVLAEAEALGYGTIVVPAVPHPETAAQAAEQIERLRGAAAIAERGGLAFAYHNHDFEFRELDDGADFWSRLLPEGFGHELDAGWLYAAGQDPAATIAQLSGRVPLVHAKDMRRDGDGFIDVPAGDGELDFAAIARAAGDAGAEWLVIEMDNPSDDPVDDVSRSLAALQAALP